MIACLRHEYLEKRGVARLIGAPPGDVGYDGGKKTIWLQARAHAGGGADVAQEG